MPGKEPKIIVPIVDKEQSGIDIGFKRMLNGAGGRFSLVTKLCCLLFVFSCLLYANTLQNGYVLDDGIVLSENAIVQKGIKAIPELFSTPHMRGRLISVNETYRPLSLSMFAIEYEFFGLNPMVGHLFNVLVFACCVLLLFRFLYKLFGGSNMIAAFAAALLFAAHPIHTEVVANIKSRDELLCFFFAFLSLNVFMNYMKKGGIARLCYGVLALFLSYLSKETVITFVFIIPLIFFFYYNDDRRRAISITTGMGVVTVVFLILRYIVLHQYNAGQASAIEFMDNPLSNAPSVISRFATEVVILGKYFLLLFVPYPLLCDYSFNAIPFANVTDVRFLSSLLVYVLLIFIAIKRWIKDKKDRFALGIVIYLVCILLCSNIPFLIGAEMAERFTFFASAGFCMAVGAMMQKSLIKKNSIIVIGVLLPVILIFSGITVARNVNWESNYALFHHDMDQSPNDSRLHLYTAATIMNELYPFETDSASRLALRNECIADLRRSLEIYPGYAAAHYELGRVFKLSNLPDSANAHIITALSLYGNDAVRYSNEGNNFVAEGNYAMAKYCCRKSIAIDPRAKYPFYTLADAYLKSGQYDSAVLTFHSALTIDAKYVSAYQGIATAYSKLHNFDSAEFYSLRTIALAPEDLNAMYSLGALYLNFIKYDKAIEEFKQIIGLNINYSPAYGGLGLAYYKSKRYEAAIEAFNAGLNIAPDDTRYLPYIAFAYKQTGNKEMALKYEALAKQYFPDFTFDRLLE